MTPKWLGLLAVVVVLGGLFVRLGFWQYEVAQADARQEALDAALAQPVLPLDEVIQPHMPFPDTGSNQRVEAVGRYEPERLRYVPQRLLDGVEGRWAIVPFVVESTGARIPVLRGFLAGSAHVAADPPAPAGRLTVVGSLAPSESPRSGQGLLPEGEIGSVDLGELVNLWGGEVYNGFLFAISETPDPGDIAAVGSGSAAVSPGVLERVPPPDVPTGLSMRNAAYALQWWLFAVFGLWMWVKMVRDDHRRRVLQPAGDPS